MTNRIITPRRELIEVYETSPKLVLTEDSRPGKLIVRGEFARAGVPTANKRVYSSRLWNREFERLQESIRARTVTGELNHPKDGRADLFNTSHLITGLTLTPEGIVIGEAEVMEELPGGKVVAAVYRRKGKVGVSSRGFGSTRMGSDGNELVEDDYQLVTFDFVSDPADQYAYPELVTETSRFYSIPMGESTTMTESPEIAALRAELAQRMIASVEEVRKTAESAVLERIQKNPGALPAGVQESLRSFFKSGGDAPSLQKQNAVLRASLGEARAKADRAEAECARAVQMARTASFRFFLERTARTSEDGDAIIEAIGDVSTYESAAALKAKVEEVQKSIIERRAMEEEARREAAEATRALAEERAADAQRIEKLETALSKSLALNRELTVANYQSEQTALAPPNARAVVEAARPRTPLDVDRILEELRPARQTPDQTESARARARNWVGSRSRASTPMQEERSTGTRTEESYQGLGVSLRELQALSGVGQS